MVLSCLNPKIISALQAELTPEQASCLRVKRVNNQQLFDKISIFFNGLQQL